MNPFTLTYDALYQTAVDNKVLQEYIRPKNFVKLDKDMIKKTGVNTADLPELLLTQTSVSGQIIASSSTTLVEVNYVFAAAMGSWDLSGLASDIQWGLLTTSCSWCANLGKLEWNENNFIKSVELGDVTVTLADFEANRGISGWSLTWPLQVSMRLRTSELRNFQLKE